MDSPTSGPPPWISAAILLAALAPAVAAIAVHPGFETQDGPAHAYNAHILAESVRADSPFRSAFEVRWSPLPNWAGHLSLLALMTIATPRSADRILTAITLLGVSGSALWLRWRVRGRSGLVPSALFAAMLGLNVAWLLGFESFLLGTCLVPITLGTWWAGRDRIGPGRSIGIAALLVAGYGAHLVSLGLTAVGLVVLALATPGPGSRRRGLFTAASLAVLIPLGALYRGQMSQGGAFRPIWHELTSPWAISGWLKQVAWVDPLTIGRKVLPPFGSAPTRWAGLIAPVLWFGLGLATAAIPAVRERPEPGLRGWAVLACLLILGGIVGPDSFGAGHGDYLPQRVLLVGLIALLPVLGFGANRVVDRLASAFLAVALVVQSAYLWDYAIDSGRRVGEILAIRVAVGRSESVGTLILDLRGRFRANPMLHADCLLGIGTGDVIWSNYEAAHYYFPVHFRPGLPHPPELEFERISVMDDPADAPARRARWRNLLEAYRGEIDRLVILGDDAGLDAITRLWYEPSIREGRVTVWRRR